MIKTEVPGKIEIEDLIDFLEDTLSIERKEEIEKLMIENTHYYGILKGLKVLLEELGDKDAILIQLSEEKNIMKNRIFSSTLKRVKKLNKV